MSNLIKKYYWRKLTVDGLLKKPEEGLCTLALTSWGQDTLEEAEEALSSYYDRGGCGEFVLLTVYGKDHCND